MGCIIDKLTISNIHSAGKAVGVHEGKNIFVPFATSGDVVRVELDRRQRGFYSVSTMELLTPSENRTSPFCPHFGHCGGCNWQHIAYEEQLKLKRQILVQAFEKYQIKVPWVPEVKASPQLTCFRNKLDYAFAHQGISVHGEMLANVVGFHPADRRDVVLSIDHCYLQSDISHKIAFSIRALAFKHEGTFWDYSSRKGLLRNHVLRTSSKGEVMAIFGFTSDELDHVLPFINEGSNYFQALHSLYDTVLSSPEKGYADGNMILVRGPSYLNEEMDKIRYRLSPKALKHFINLTSSKLTMFMKQLYNWEILRVTNGYTICIPVLVP